MLVIDKKFQRYEPQGNLDQIFGILNRSYSSLGLSLKNAKPDRAHILEGLRIDFIDEIIAIIRGSRYRSSQGSVN